MVGTSVIALYAATTEIGRDRLFVAFAEIHEVLIPTGVTPIRPLCASTIILQIDRPSPVPVIRSLVENWRYF